MVKSKDKSCPCASTEHHAMKTYWESGGIVPQTPLPTSH